MAIERKIGNTTFSAIEGDITQIDTDAIMTAINSGGMWFGGLDRAIQGVAGGHYHKQAVAAMPLKDLQTVVARGDKTQHLGKFNDVIFVVDDLQSPLDQVVYTGLEAAHTEGYERVLMPAIRTGVMRCAFEDSMELTAKRFGEGVGRFMKDYGSKTALRDLKLIVYNDPETLEQLGAGFLVLGRAEKSPRRF